LQARFVERDHVIETLATRGSNESLDEGILPRRVWCGEHFLNPVLSKNPIAPNPSAYVA
jgi:hypothetical protein